MPDLEQLISHFMISILIILNPYNILRYTCIYIPIYTIYIFFKLEKPYSKSRACEYYRIIEIIKFE